jgi:hypothetical protein
MLSWAESLNIGQGTRSCAFVLLGCCRIVEKYVICARP